MKIDVNYELMEKIDVAKFGFNVRKVSKKMIFLESCMFLTSCLISQDSKEFASNMLYATSLTAFHSIIPGLIDGLVDKIKAKDDLKVLSSRLKDLDVYTDNELLLKSEAYKTKYKINFSDGIIPKIMQNKYIMVPTSNEGEVSLLQEHIIGAKEYALSVGEPEKQRQYRLAYNGI